MLPDVGRGNWVGFEPSWHLAKDCLPSLLKAGMEGGEGASAMQLPVSSHLN